MGPERAVRAWWNGRHMALKMPGPEGRAGSNPAARTNPVERSMDWQNFCDIVVGLIGGFESRLTLPYHQGSPSQNLPARPETFCFLPP